MPYQFLVPVIIFLSLAINTLAAQPDSARQQTVYSTDLAKSHVLLGLTHLKLDDYMNALAEFEKALQADPQVQFHRDKMTAFYCELGMIYVMNYDLFGSIKFFRRSLALDQECRKARDALSATYSLIAEEFAVTNKPDSAKMYFALALKVNPNVKFDAILRIFDEPMCNIAGLEDMNQDLALTYCAIARQYYKEKKFKVARGYYELAIKLQPNLSRAQKGLVKVNSLAQ